MNIAVEPLAPCVRRLTIDIPADRVQRELETIYKSLQKRVRLPGFRPGRVPRRILETQYRGAVEQEVMQKLVPEALSEALTRENLRPVGEPHIDQMVLNKGEPLHLVATVQILPEFEIGDYQGWPFERRIPEVTEAEVDQALQNVRERHAALQTVADRPVQMGDFVIIDYKGFVDDRPLSGAEGTNVVIEVGAGEFLSEIEQGLVGMSQGEEKTITVHFPEDHPQPSLAGQTLQFWVRVAEIKEKVLPELDDEFAQAYEDADSLAALRQRLREELEAAARQRADEALRQDILDRLVAENPVEVPDTLLQDQMRRMYLRQRQQETGGQVTEADAWVDPDSLREDFEAPARKVVQGQLILHRLGQDLGLQVTPEEVDAEVASMAARMAQNPDALKKAMERNGTLSTLEANLRDRKIFDAIMSHMQITDKLVPAEAATPEASGG